MNARESILEPVQRLRGFLEESWAEVKKVHFPTRKEVRGATIVVVVGVLIVSAYLGLVDFLITKALQVLLF